MAACDPSFFNSWNVTYINEPQYSGEMTILDSGEGIIVLGLIKKNGTIDSSYTGGSVSCSREREMKFIYLLDTGGFRGEINLKLENSNLITGVYRDYGNGGDRGNVKLMPI